MCSLLWLLLFPTAMARVMAIPPILCFAALDTAHTGRTPLYLDPRLVRANRAGTRSDAVSTWCVEHSTKAKRLESVAAWNSQQIATHNPDWESSRQRSDNLLATRIVPLVRH